MSHHYDDHVEPASLDHDDEHKTAYYTKVFSRQQTYSKTDWQRSETPLETEEAMQKLAPYAEERRHSAGSEAESLGDTRGLEGEELRHTQEAHATVDVDEVAAPVGASQPAAATAHGKGWTCCTMRFDEQWTMTCAASLYLLFPLSFPLFPFSFFWFLEAALASVIQQSDRNGGQAQATQSAGETTPIYPKPQSKAKRSCWAALFGWCRGRPKERRPPSTGSTASTAAASVPPQPISLLPPLEGEKPCLVLDLDETLVHSSFQPVAGVDYVLPVVIEGYTHQVYVRKRPYCDEFLLEASKYFEVVVFTASLSKVGPAAVCATLCPVLTRQPCLPWA